MARRRYSTREKILALAQRYTQREIAKRLNIGERTVRRWKNEGTEPSTPARAGRLQVSFEREHKRVTQEQTRDARKHPGAVRLKRAKVLPRGMRRVLPVYDAKGKKTRRHRESEWINYDTAKLSVEEIHAVLVELRDAGRIVQLIYKIPKGSRYPRDPHTGRPGKVVKKSTRSGSPPLDLSNLDDGELMDFLLQYTDPEPGPKSRRIMFVAALDAKLREQ
jgi:hypothetical protein